MKLPLDAAGATPQITLVSNARLWIFVIVILAVLVTVGDFWWENFQRGTFSVAVYGQSWQVRPWSLALSTFLLGVITCILVLLLWHAARWLHLVDRIRQRGKPTEPEAAP